jgi:2-polyprenyl-3-methyl-5-hydroxy-6-metoxy-1,4-benzoquinol methylase
VGGIALGHEQRCRSSPTSDRGDNASTHRWSRFLRPSEAARPLRQSGLGLTDLSGVVYDPLRDRFRLSTDPSVNYMLFAVRD